MPGRNIQPQPVNKWWDAAEKVLAILISLWGIFTIYSLATALSDQVYDDYLQSVPTSYVQVAKDNHLPAILSLLSIFGGFLLYFNDKEGWVMCLPATAMYAINFFITWVNSADSTLSYARYYKNYGFTVLVLIGVTVFLLQKPVWKKYKPTAKTWLFMGALLLVFIVDRLIF